MRLYKSRWAGLLLIIVMCLVGCANTSSSEAEPVTETESATETEPVTETETETEKEPEPTTESEPVTDTDKKVTSVTITAAGDCALGALQYHGYSSSFHSYYDKYGEEYFFEKFKDIFSVDDLTIVNLECVFTKEKDRVEKKYNIKGYPKYAGILSSSSIEVCSMGNNHSSDYGDKSRTDTMAALDKKGVQYAYNELVAYYTTKDDIKVAVLSASLLSQRKVTQPILEKALKGARKQADLVIATCHWGVEGRNYPNNYQQKMAHKLIDAGADLVIGTHPHVLQGIEYYKGKIICYSLGNFSFGANRNPEDRDTVVYQQTFYFENGTLQPKLEASIIPSRLCKGESGNNFQPILASKKQAKNIIKRMNTYSSKYSKLQIDEDGTITINE